MHRTRIKICGLTRREDIIHAVSAGADALGLVFYAKSPRSVTIEQATELLDGLPPMVASVALFVDSDPADVEAVIARLRPSLLQFHGAESAAFCAQFGVPYMKALHLPQPDIASERREQALALLRRNIEEHQDASAFLLDTLSEKGHGGTGQTFDHAHWPKDCRKPLVMAGGLRSENVAAAIVRCRPYAVDVSSGVERAPGEKDKQAIENFVGAVKDVRN